MIDQKSSYRQIMKATSLFGGVQVFNIIILIIRSKVVAVLLGPTGMGIMGLFNSTIAIIGNFTNFGLQTSAVKDVSGANRTGNTIQISAVVTVLRRLVWITGILGTLVTLLFSSWLSQLTFGNKDYTLAFVWISVTLLLKQLTSGQLVVLQGLRKLKYLAKANLSGSFLGLIITLPLYYKWGVDGIVPGIIGTALITLLSTFYFSHKVEIEYVKINRAQTFEAGKEMMKMGFMISLSGLFVIAASYILRIFISRTGGVEQVGLYNAGFAIINTYVGLIFTAMATDYYPRLSADTHNIKLYKKTINQQAEIAILILAPILIVFLTFINWIIILLYSHQFTPVNGMIYWAVLGMFFKAAGWSVAFLFLAKGASKIFFWNELVFNIYMLGLNLLCYHYWGLTGLGISFSMAYILYLIQVLIISNVKFNFSFEKVFIKIFGLQFVLTLFGFVGINVLDKPYSYINGIVLIIISCWYSYRELDKRIGIKEIICKINRKYKK
jgi:O-antigen/teichoic acid export membrane protein